MIDYTLLKNLPWDLTTENAEDGVLLEVEPGTIRDIARMAGAVSFHNDLLAHLMGFLGSDETTPAEVERILDGAAALFLAMAMGVSARSQVTIADDAPVGVGPGAQVIIHHRDSVHVDWQEVMRAPGGRALALWAALDTAIIWERG